MRVFIIAEAGVNHNGSINLAKKLIDVASNAGAGTFKRISTWPSSDTSATIDTPQTRTYVFDFTSYDAGTTVWANYIGYFA